MTWMPSSLAIESLSARNKLLLWLVQLCLLLALLGYLYLAKSFTVVADINQIFTVEQTEDVRLVSTQVDQSQLRQHVILVGHSQRDIAIKHAEYAAKELAQVEGIKVTVKFPPLPQLSTVVDDYLPYQHAFLSDAYRTVLQSNDADAIFNYQFSLLNDIGSPWVATTLESDPSLSLADFFNQQHLATTALKNDKGYLIAQQRNLNGEKIYYILITFVCAETGLDLNIANRIDAKVTELKYLNAVQDTGVEYLATGAAFFTASASNSAQNEMTIFGGVSLVATFILILLIYRSALSVLYTLFVIAISVLYGYCALRLFFTEVNILTLVFAVTLIGIAADYSFHALSELRFSKVNLPSPLTGIRSSLLLGFITTTAGYLILVLTPLALFQQIAVFTIGGLLGALLTVLLVFPMLAGTLAKTTQPIPNIISRLNSLQQVLINKRTGFIWQVILVAILLAVLMNVRNNDDPRSFYKSSADLIAQQQQISQILNSHWDSPYILVAGDSAQQTLQRNEQLLAVLDELKNSKAITDYTSISQWLPSIAAQKEAQQLVKQAQKSGLFKQLNTVLGESTQLQGASYSQLDFATWQQSQIAPLFYDQWFEINNRYYSIIKLRGINDTVMLKNSLTDYNGTVFVDKVAAVSEQIGKFREHLVVIYFFALAAAMIVFWLRYGVINALVAVSRPVLAMLVALTLSAWLFDGLTVFNYVAGILILALGLDYCVFYAEHGSCEKITLTTLISALSSLLVFAILIVSSTPAVSQFGFTVFIGVVVVFMIAPRLALVSKRNI